MRSSAHDSRARAEASNAPNSPPNVSRVLMDSAPASLADATTPEGRRAERGAGCWPTPRTVLAHRSHSLRRSLVALRAARHDDLFGVVIARRPSANVYVGHLYGR